MNIVALDLSTKPGYAVYFDGTLAHYGTHYALNVAEDLGTYPFNYLALARSIADRLYTQVIKPAIDKTKGNLIFVIEETTGGAGSNYSQKKLEFVHWAVLEKLQGQRVYYVRDGSWKSVAGVKLSPDDKKINKQIKDYKDRTGEKLAKLDLDGLGLKVVGKITVQHVYLRRLKEIFGIVLPHKAEDQAAAILLGYAFLKGVKLCDGIVKKKPKKVKTPKVKKAKKGA